MVYLEKDLFLDEALKELCKAPDHALLIRRSEKAEHATKLIDRLRTKGVRVLMDEQVIIVKAEQVLPPRMAEQWLLKNWLHTGHREGTFEQHKKELGLLDADYVVVGQLRPVRQSAVSRPAIRKV